MKKLDKYKKFLLPILSFLIPCVIFILFCWSRKIGVFGENSLLISDFQAQYVILLKYLRNLEDGNLWYSLSKGLGGGMIGTFAYYLSSPLNLLIFLFPKSAIVDVSILLIGLKISLCGLTMYFFLRHHFKRQRYHYLIFSTCYALMSFMINYNFHIMWLDCVMIFPLVMLGIDRLFEGKSGLYIGSLFYAILSNYYIGYMICIMSVLYFIGQIILTYNKKQVNEIKKVCLRFGITSILAGCMAMFLLIPTILELQHGYKVNSSGLDFSGLHLNFFDLWSRTYVSSHNYLNILAKNEISIYCGIIVLPLLYFFFVNKKILRKEKWVYGCLLVLLVSGFFVNGLNMVFHAFNEANCFNYRYSFMICFVMIVMAVKSFQQLKDIPIYHYLLFLIFYLVMALIMCISSYSYLGLSDIYISIGCIILYMLLLYYYPRYTKNNDIKILLLLIVFSELLCNFFLTLSDFPYYKKEEYDYYAMTMASTMQDLQKDAPGYRIEKNMFFSYNDSLLMQYHGINSFLSTVDINQINFLHNTGYYSTRMSSVDYGHNSILMDSLLGIKYRISSFLLTEYTEIKQILYPQFSGILYHSDFLRSAMVYENPYALSLGYMVNSTSVMPEVDNPFEYQNALLNNMLGTDTPYFKPYDKEKVAEGAYEFTIDNDELVYIYFAYITGVDEQCSVLIDGKLANTNSEIFPYRKNLSGEKIRVALDGKVVNYGAAYAYYLDMEAFKQAISSLQKSQVQIETVEDGYIKGSVTATKEMPTLFLSIPYEDGWTLYVDGKEKKIDIMYDAFMGVSLDEGDHTIELKYEVPGLKLGMLITGLSGLFTGLYLYFEHKKRKELTNKA